jgi:hypothetical protein
MRTLHGSALLADFVVRLLSTLNDKFQRHRIWSPRMVVLALMLAASFGSGRGRLAWKPLLMRLRQEYGDTLEWDGVPDPTGLYRAMAKVKVTVLRQTLLVAEAILTQVVRHAPLVEGQRLIAIDGTRLSVRRTTSLARRFGLPRGKSGAKPCHYPQALAVIAYDVLSKTVVAYELASHRASERTLAKRLLAKLGTNCIVLMDRGFPSREILDALVGSGIPFVMRMVAADDGSWPEVRAFLHTGARCGRIGLTARAPDGTRSIVTTRLVQSRAPRQGRPRCNRTPKRLLVATNLMATHWTDSTVIKLYLRRWDIETIFREIKGYLAAEGCLAVTPEAVEKELLGALIAQTIAAAAEIVAATMVTQDAWHDPRARRFVFTLSLQVIAAAIAVALCDTPANRKTLDDLLAFMGKHRQRRRPGRAEKRHAFRVGSKWHMQQDRGVR